MSETNKSPADKATPASEPKAHVAFTKAEAAILWELVNLATVKAPAARTFADLLGKVEDIAKGFGIIE